MIQIKNKYNIGDKFLHFDLDEEIIEQAIDGIEYYKSEKYEEVHYFLEKTKLHITSQGRPFCAEYIEKIHQEIYEILCFDQLKIKGL